MSETIIDEISSTNGLTTTETKSLIKESCVNNEDEETWLYGKQKNEENMDSTTAPSIDEVTTQEIDDREKVTIPLTTNPPTSSFIGSHLDDDSDDDDDGIQVTIGNIKSGASIFPPSRQNSRTTIPSGPVIPPKPQVIRGVDLDAQGLINGQSTYEHDLNSYKEDEKPWKKPGADISDYFNYGFTEETWAQYCDRQRRLRAENNLVRLNTAHIPQMPPMIPGHPPMIHPMNPHPAMMMNKPPINMPIMQRPFMNVRKQDGKIDVIGATDQTSRRQMFEAPNTFEHPPFMNGPPFPGGQPPNGQTVGDLVTPSPTSNGPPPAHGTPPGASHHIPTLGAHRLAMMPPPPGMQFRPQFGHPHAPGAPPFFPHGPAPAMHGERPPQPYFVPHHPQQPWEKAGVPPVHGFPPGHFPPQVPVPANTGNGRPPSSRSPTPEDHSSRSSTPEENRPSGASGENEKSSKDDRYKERYRDDREHYSSSRRRSSPKDRGSSSYRSRHRSGDHEYERPRSDRKSSRERDDKYERYSRKRHHREEGSRHHRGDDELSRSHRSRRTPTKNFSSPPKTLVPNNSQGSSTEPSQITSENTETTENDQSSNIITSTTNPIIPSSSSSSSPTSRSRRDESERSSSRHGHHKKSSKRSRRDSDDERSHHRHSKDKSNSSKKSSNQIDPSSDIKEQLNE